MIVNYSKFLKQHHMIEAPCHCNNSKKPFDVYCRIVHAYTIIYFNIGFFALLLLLISFSALHLRRVARVGGSSGPGGLSASGLRHCSLCNLPTKPGATVLLQKLRCAFWLECQDILAALHKVDDHRLQLSVLPSAAKAPKARPTNLFFCKITESHRHSPPKGSP